MPKRLIQKTCFSVTTDAIRGQSRPRFGRGHAYKSSDAQAWEDAILSAFMAQGGTDRASFADEVHIKVSTSRKLPKSRPKYIQSEPDTFKPDIDNVCKAVLDALNGHAYKDDRQVTLLHGEKLPRTRRDDELLVVEVSYLCEVKERRGNAYK